MREQTCEGDRPTSSDSGGGRGKNTAPRRFGSGRFPDSALQQLPQDEGENPAVAEVGRLLRRVDPHAGAELDRLPVGSLGAYFEAARLERRREPGEVDRLAPREAERRGALPLGELQ